MRRTFHFTIILIALFVLSASTTSFALDNKADEGSTVPKSLKVGDDCIDFSLKNGLTKEDVSFFRDIIGKHEITAILFMTTTCSACKAEMALLHNIASKNDGFKLYAVCVDMEGELTIPAYHEEYGFKATYMLDPDFTIPSKFGFIYTPGLVLLDKEGKIILLKGGFAPKKKYDFIEKIESFLN